MAAKFLLLMVVLESMYAQDITTTTDDQYEFITTTDDDHDFFITTRDGTSATPDFFTTTEDSITATDDFITTADDFFTTTDDPGWCWFEYNSCSGSISFPLGGGHYRNNEYCIWIIRTTNPISITFTYIDIEYRYDYLDIRDGETIASPLIGRLTGRSVNEPILTTSNASYLQFSSDHIVTRTGFKLHWECFEPIGCEFDGVTYKHGAQLPFSCTRFVCRNGTIIYDGYLDEECPKCKIYLDPHIVTYEQKYSSYSYQGCGNYSLSQNGNDYNPTFALYSTFKPCGGRKDVTCVDIVTFKNDEHTAITIKFTDKIQLTVNGDPYTVPGSLPSIVEVNDTVYPVWAWTSGHNCVNLLGTSSLLVRFCGFSRANEVYAWADLDIAEQLEGLCGTINNNNFTTRNRAMTWPWRRDAPLEFGLSWLNSTTSNGSCESSDVRVKRQAQDRCEVNSSALYDIQIQCNTTVMNGFSNAEPEEAQAIIDDCVFDLCNVSDPDSWIKSVEQTVQNQAEIQENTINVTATTEAPTPPPKPQPTSLPAQTPTTFSTQPSTPSPTQPTPQPTQPPTQPPTPPPTPPPTLLSTKSSTEPSIPSPTQPSTPPLTASPNDLTTTPEVLTTPAKPSTKSPPTQLPKPPPDDLSNHNIILQIRQRVNWNNGRP